MCRAKASAVVSLGTYAPREDTVGGCRPERSEGSLGTCVPRDDKKGCVPREDKKKGVPRDDIPDAVQNEVRDASVSLGRSK